MIEKSFEEYLCRGIAALMAANPESTTPLTWHDNDDVYPDGTDFAGFIDSWPELRGGSFTVSDYTVDDSPSLSDSVVGIQITFWHRDRSKLKAAVSDTFNLLHGRWGGMIGGIALVSARRTSGTSLGQDSNDRQGRVENYYLTVHRPSTNRS